MEAALLPRDLVSPTVLEGHNCSGTTAREDGWGNHSHSAPQGWWWHLHQSWQQMLAERGGALDEGLCLAVSAPCLEGTWPVSQRKEEKLQ